MEIFAGIIGFIIGKIFFTIILYNPDNLTGERND